MLIFKKGSHGIDWIIGMLHTKNESQEILNLLPKVKILYTQGESHETKPRLGQNKNKKSIFQACI